MDESRIINRVYNRTSLEYCEINTQRAFLELVLCVESQKLVPEFEDDAWVNQMTRLVKKLREEFNL